MIDVLVDKVFKLNCILGCFFRVIGKDIVFLIIGRKIFLYGSNEINRKKSKKINK